MIAKLTLAYAVVIAMPGLTIASDAGDPVAANETKIGDIVILRLTGDLAVELCKRDGELKANDTPPSGLGVEIPAQVCQKLKGNRLRIECDTPSIANQNKQQQMITISAVVDAKQIERYEIPAGPVYSTPVAEKERNVKKAEYSGPSHGQRLELSDLKQVKLRVWTLTEEIGN